MLPVVSRSAQYREGFSLLPSEFAARRGVARRGVARLLTWMCITRECPHKATHKLLVVCARPNVAELKYMTNGNNYNGPNPGNPLSVRGDTCRGNGFANFALRRLPTSKCFAAGALGPSHVWKMSKRGTSEDESVSYLYTSSPARTFACSATFGCHSGQAWFWTCFTADDFYS